MEVNAEITSNDKTLTTSDELKLSLQNSRKVSDHAAQMLEVHAKKHWDLFYKRNETRFFKDRHWTTREFQELLDIEDSSCRTLFEVGCGVGNFVYPLVEEKLNFKIFACDFSPRAVEMAKSNPNYDSNTMTIFQCDITSDEVFKHIHEKSIDIATLIFVLSAIHPDKFVATLKNIYKLLKPGGLLLFRDYGLYDMAQLRFKPGHKIDENFYMRQDGTRSYYFSLDYLEKMFKAAGFDIVTSTYVHKKTINRKENMCVPRVFVQSKVRRQLEEVICISSLISIICIVYS